MTKINLLPPEKVKARRGATSERSYLWLVILLPLIVLIVIVLLYFQVSGKVSQKQKALTDARRELTDWQNKNAALQQYKTRQDQILSLIHISEPTRLGMISYAVFCLKKKKK